MRRGERLFAPDPKDQLFAGDQIYVFVHTEDVNSTVELYGKSVTKQDRVVIVGGGPIGMATALDLGRRGTPVLVLDDHEGVGQGSRAICFAKRTLEIADRLGAGQRMRDKGVVWNVGKVFHGPEKVFEFNLQPEDGHKNPAFINLQQPYFE